jgi:hypothetical protein
MYEVLSASTPRPSVVAAHLREHVFFVVVPDGTGRLLNLNGSFYALDATGTKLLHHALMFPGPVAVSRLAALLRVDARIVADDLELLVGELQRRQLVAKSHEIETGRRGASCWKLAVMRVALTLLGYTGRSLEMSVAASMFLAFCAVRSIGLGSVAQACYEWAATSRTVRCDDGAKEYVCDSLRRALRARTAKGWLSYSCKERAVAGFVAGRLHGVVGSMVLAIDIHPFRAHLWFESHGAIISDQGTLRTKFEPVAILASSESLSHSGSAV